MHKRCFWEEDLMIRNGMDILQFSPFLNSKPDEMTQTFEKIRKLLDLVD
jgi:adenosylmethionine-8-amino-7-oxononanoate aminotransferase